RASRPPERAEREPMRLPGGDLTGRILVAVPAALLAIGFDKLGGAGWAVLMGIFAVLGVTELSRMLERWKPVTWAAAVVVAGMCAAALLGGAHATMGVALLALPLAFIGVATRPDLKGSSIAIAGTLLGVLWIGFAFSHAVLLRQLPHGAGVVIDVMVGTFLGDIGAYFGGRYIGRRPLAPKISPNKTVEGLVCGALAAVVGVFLAHLSQNQWMSQTQALGLGLACAFLGPIGDLFESLIKRDAGTKDAGRLFGAHGGVLDRLDAISFTIIAGYYIWSAIPH
ncbi:MAG: phosphatidate cytidylyltransferase, partial [Solirubrobacterales bacterium]|nr:phosphatidate cytidylyltransferase [Solirubrobacterales bacterium]